MVTQAVLKNELLHIRHHKAFKVIKLNPVWNFDKKTTLKWIEKKKEFQKSNMVYAEEDEEDKVEDENGEDEDDLNYYSDDDDDEYIEEMLAEYDEDEYMIL